MISAARLTPLPITINNREIPFTQSGKLLGLTITNRGITTHVTEKVRMASIQLGKCKRFSNCSQQVKLHLYKALIRPILEYPPVPLNTISYSLMQKLQTMQNGALIWVAGCRYPNIPSSRSLHNTYNIVPMNMRIHNLAKRVWERLEMWEDPNFLQIMNNNLTNENHTWFPRSIPLTLIEPEPIYRRRRQARLPADRLNNPDDPD